MSYEILNYTSSKIQNNAKDNEEKRANERKKNLLYLISTYLYDNGFIHSSESLVKEAQLPNNIEVCDNVDLDIILQEYSNYYYMKFNKYPKFCRKLTGEQIVPKSPNQKSISTKPLKSAAAKKNEVLPVQKSINPLVVTPLLQNEEDNRKKLEHEYLKRNTLSDLKPLYDFPGCNNEWKELAECIYKDILITEANVTWDDVKGVEEAKMLLQEALTYPIQYPKLFSKIPVPWKGILLFGPPGTGKTLLAKAVSRECRQNTFFNMSASCLISKWRGESEKLVRVLFDLSKYQAPSIIFIDELDALASKREECQHDATRRFKSELLVQMDGIATQNDNVFILATSNLPWDIDPAILRRFEKRILIDYPDVSARKKMFRYYLKLWSDPSNITDLELNYFAKNTTGYTGSDIKLICKESALIPIRREITKSAGDSNTMCSKPLSVDDITQAIKNTKPSVKYDASKYQEWSKEFGCL